jgi:hypothetical protein
LDSPFPEEIGKNIAFPVQIRKRQGSSAIGIDNRRLLGKTLGRFFQKIKNGYFRIT